MPQTVRSAEANATINNNYHERYHGGVRKYLLEMKEVYAKLDQLAEEQALRNGANAEFIPDKNRLDNVRTKLLPFPEFRPMLSSAQTLGYNFEKSIAYFLEEVMTIDYANFNIAAQRSRGRRVNLTDAGG